MCPKPRSSLPCAALAALLAVGLPAHAARLSSGARAKPMPGRSEGALERLLGAGTSLTSGAAVKTIQPVHLSYYGGRVLDHVQLVAVFWGTPDPALRTRIEGWYGAFASGPATDWLSEYSTTGVSAIGGGAGTSQTLGRGSYAGSAVIEPDAASTTPSVKGSAVIARLQAALDNGEVPKPGDQALYMIHFAPGVTVSDSSGTACVDYCAYHDSFLSGAQTVLYAVIPDHAPPSGCATCGEFADWFQNLGGSASHEAVEAITDPDVGQVAANAGSAWFDPAPDSVLSHAEIGDICADYSLTGVSEASFGSGSALWTVQREWSNRYGACIAGGDDGLSLSAPAYVLYKPGDTLDLALGTNSPGSGPVSVALSAVLPAGLKGLGVTAALSASKVQSGGSASVRVTTTAQSPVRFTLAALGETGRAQPIAVIAFGPADFTLQGGGKLSLTAGGAAAPVTLHTADLAGGVRPLHLTGASVDGVTATLPKPLSVGDTFTVQVAAAAGTPTSASKLSLDFADGASGHSALFDLVVSGDDFALTPPAPVSGKAGSDATFTVQTQTTHGQAQPLTLSVTGLTGGSTATVTPATVQSGASAQVTLHLASGATLGPGTFALTATGPIAHSSVDVSLQVAAGGCSSAGGAPWLALLLPLLWRRRRAL